MIVYPAIDLRAGQAVRLLEGDFDQETVYDVDPVARARDFVSQGASWLHLVDLDAARGSGDNRETVKAIVEAVDVPVQVGGGIADLSLLECGVSRLVVGSLLLRDRNLAGELSRKAPGQVAFGLDHRNGELRVGGWMEGSGLQIDEVLGWPEVRSAAAVIVTDISTDGALTGPPVADLQRLAGASPCPLIASGGVSSLADLVALEGTGVAGVIVGRALYEHRFSVAEALEACR